DGRWSGCRSGRRRRRHWNKCSCGPFPPRCRRIYRRIKWLHGHWVDNSVTHVGASEFEAYAIDGGIVAPENAEIYNLSGCKVSADNLPAGVYIVRLGSQARKILVR
ncbi:MAG: T9SS type A sorting domain-containing protein, partial [Muribaculaceae bacterium]|nr:T9SS type A sorting domain-containing protein [Muribaculaceae bacterium]